MNNYHTRYPHCPPCPPCSNKTKYMGKYMDEPPVPSATLLLRNSASPPSMWYGDSTVLVKLYTNGWPQQEGENPYEVPPRSDLGWFELPGGTTLRLEAIFKEQLHSRVHPSGYYTWTVLDGLTLEPGKSYVFYQHADCCKDAVSIEIKEA